MQTLVDEIKTHIPVYPVPPAADEIIDAFMVACVNGHFD